MSERTDQRTAGDRDDPLGESLDTEPGTTVGPDVDSGVGPRDRTEAATDAAETDRLRARFASPFAGVFSLRLFVLLLAVTAATMLAADLFVPLGGVAGYLGVALVGFVVGLGTDQPRYLELLGAGGIAAGVSGFLGRLLLVTVGVGVPLVLVAAGIGSVVAALGHYFGRDLRDGLTREL